MTTKKIDVLKKQISTFPDAPGIYLFYGKKKTLLYVGKATSLRNRVKSYFVGKQGMRPIEIFIHKIDSIRYKETPSVLEAVIAEANAIRKYEPKYNVIGKDNKSWNYIVITKDRYPTVKTIRQRELAILQKEGSKTLANFQYIFGPYPGMNATATLKVLRQLFSYSTCQNQKRKRPCFYRQIDQCLGVCTEDLSPATYKTQVITPLKMFLDGKKKRLITTLQKRMEQTAQKEQYEEAGRLRDQIHALQKIQDVQLINKSFFSTPLVPNVGFSTGTDFRIEGYDISHFGKDKIVGSMVVFDKEHAIKAEYKKFRMKRISSPNDVASLQEVLTRRLKHTEWQYPDMILVDGGVPQVRAVEKILQAQGISIPLIGMAKGQTRKKHDIVLSTFAKKKEVIQWIQKHMDLLVQVRDEAHRFAIKYQRALRKRK